MKNWGLSDHTLTAIRKVLAQFPAVEKAIIYGSRAKGNYREGSDIDLTLVGENLNAQTLNDIDLALDDLLLPYKIDLSLLADLTHVPLTEDIQRVGEVLYEGEKGQAYESTKHRPIACTKISEIADLNYGFTASADFEAAGPRFLRITDIQNGHVNWSTVPSCAISRDEYLKFKLFPGDILFARTGATTGKSYILTEEVEAVAASYLIRLRLRNRMVDPMFVWYFFQSTEYFEQIAAGISGSAQGGFNATKLGNVTVPLPSLDEQKRIVAILDEAFAGIAKAQANIERNIENAKEMFEAAIEMSLVAQTNVHGITTLSMLAEEVTDGDHQPPPKSASGVPFITISNIDKERCSIDFSDTFFVPKAYFEGLKKSRRPTRNDVLYSVTGSFGIPVVVRTDREFCFQRHIGLIRPKAGVSSDWLFFMLLSKNLRTQANEGATGTAQRTVSLKHLRSFEIPNTPSDEQTRIVEKLDEVNSAHLRAVNQYHSRKSLISELRQSLLHQAFSGRLTHNQDIAA